VRRSLLLVVLMFVGSCNSSTPSFKERRSMLATQAAVPLKPPAQNLNKHASPPPAPLKHYPHVLPRDESQRDVRVVPEPLPRAPVYAPTHLSLKAKYQRLAVVAESVVLATVQSLNPVHGAHPEPVALDVRLTVLQSIAGSAAPDSAIRVVRDSHQPRLLAGRTYLFGVKQVGSRWMLVSSSVRVVEYSQGQLKTRPHTISLATARGWIHGT
jgi:hypothetical protein